MNKNNLFQGENSAFVKRPQKTKKIRRDEGQPSKNTRAGLRYPNPKKNAQKKKKKNTKAKRGGCEEDHLKFAKRAQKKEPKRRENPPHRSSKGIFSSTQSCFMVTQSLCVASPLDSPQLRRFSGWIFFSRDP